MAYDSNTGIITNPDSIYDIQQCFGSGRNDLGDLIANVAINKWAKFKPVCSYQTGLIDTYVQLNSSKRWNNSLSSQWWRDTVKANAMQTKYGIDPTISQIGLAALLRSYAIANQWPYTKPSGGSYPYRILDFHQYRHKAPQPLGSFSAPSSLILTNSEQGGWSIDVAMMKNQDDAEPIANRDYVTPEDILTAKWGRCYFGFALMKSDGTPAIWVTGNRYYGYGANGGRLSEGTYTVMPFYTDTELPQDTEGGTNLNPGPTPVGSAQFATVPNVECPQLVIPNGSVTTEDARFSVKAVLRNGRCNVKALVSAKPLSVYGGTVTFHGGTYNEVVIYVCKAGTTVGVGRPDPNDILAQQSYYSTSDPLVVNSGSEAYVGGSSSGVNFNISAEKCRVFVYAGNGSPLDTGMTARAQGDAMISSGTIVPSDGQLVTT